MALNDRQKRFVVEYCVDFNATQAAIRAGYSPHSAGAQAFPLLQNPEIAQEIEIRIREIASARAITAEWVLQQWRDIASADPNELIYLDVECCRHCYGLNFEYQWTEHEYKVLCRECSEHICNPKCEQPLCGRKFPPLAIGGFGFTPHKSPNPDCPICYGKGNEVVRLCNTRKASGPARRLYAGIKKTKDGIEIKTRDQDGALKNIAQYLGMLIDKRELTGRDGQPIPVANFSAKDLTDDQLAMIIAQAEGS